MLHVGSNAVDDDADLAVFVGRMAAAGSDAPTARAEEHVRSAIARGETPPGVRRLAEALAASVTELPPAPRQPAEDASSVVAAVGGTSLVVLDDMDDAGVAASIAALLADGRRVVVTAEAPAELERLRAALPGGVVDRVVDDLPGLAPAQVREVRRLLATSTPARRARAGQRFPDPTVLPAADEVAQMCARAARSAGRTPALGLIPQVMAGLDPHRREAVTSVARLACHALNTMPVKAESPWAWTLLGELIHHRNRPAFDQMREDTAQAGAALDWARPLPSVTISGFLPPGTLGVLQRYAEFLGSGGRPRSYLRRPVAQREVLPTLRLLRVGGRTPETLDDVRRVVEHLELGERLAQIDRGCYTLGIPAPRDEAELGRLTDVIVRIAAAARSVGALRHDVLFLAEGSPLAVPDVDTAGQVAGAILDYAEYGSVAEAEYRLDHLADALEATVPFSDRSAEHEAAVRAVRAREGGTYVLALEALGAARREAQDEQRLAVLIDQLAAHTPRLADAWAELGRADPAALGFACFRTAESLLTAVPAPDSADVVMVLGAHRLGVERLLLTAVAPRLVAVVPAGAEPEPAPTLLSVLQRAAALVIRGRPAATARVVPITAPRPQPTARVSRAGA